MMPFNPVAVAHRFVDSVVRIGDSCVDATAGNGHDTLFLAGLVGESGRVLGYDVQESAIENTRQLLAEKNLAKRVTLFNEGHETMSSEPARIEGSPIRLAMFNLGYLPGSDKSIITRQETTLKALDAILHLLQKGGAISIVAYRGHSGGAVEYDAVKRWFTNLDPVKYFCVRYERPTMRDGQSPVFFWVRYR